MTIQKILIRDETESDAAVITEVTVAAFQTLEISSHTEQFVIEALRAAKALTVSLVAGLMAGWWGILHFLPWPFQMASMTGTDLAPFQYCLYTSEWVLVKL